MYSNLVKTIAIITICYVWYVNFFKEKGCESQAPVVIHIIVLVIQNTQVCRVRAVHFDKFKQIIFNITMNLLLVYTFTYTYLCMLRRYVSKFSYMVPGAVFIILRKMWLTLFILSTTVLYNVTHNIYHY